MPHLLDNLLVFGRLLRTLGLDVHVGRMLDVTEALQHVDVGNRGDVYHTCRTLLVHRHEDLAVFDRAFDAFWRRPGGSVRLDRESLEPDRDASAPPAPHGADNRSAASSDRPRVPSAAQPEADGAATDAAEGRVPTWSDAGTLANKDFAEYTTDEIAIARSALARLSWTPGERRTRRWVPGRGYACGRETCACPEPQDGR